MQRLLLASLRPSVYKQQMRRESREPNLRNASWRTMTINLRIIVCLAAAGCTPHSLPTNTVHRCPDSVQAKVSRAKPTLTINYTEPTHDQAGRPITALSKTTIYYDVGKGRIPVRDVPATSPSGGGQISERITLPIPSDGQEEVASICVTATDRHGNESPMTP